VSLSPADCYYDDGEHFTFRHSSRPWARPGSYGRARAAATVTVSSNLMRSPQLFPTMPHPRRTGPLLLRPVPIRAAGSEGDFAGQSASPLAPGAGLSLTQRDSEADSEGETVSRLIWWPPEK
jgi:hypothetical protein